jgi:hypothetical protein
MSEIMSENAMMLASRPEEGDAMLVFMEKAGHTFGMLINSGTSLLPSNIQSVGDCVIASAFGRRFGMDPMASIYNIHIIEGRPQLRADAIVGLCKARREVCKYFMLVESSGLIATYETHRVGEPAPTRMSFTYAEAEAADLTKPTKTGKPSNWKRFPAAMCRARAGVALARAVYPDIVGGIYYPGELTDDDGFVGVEGVPDVMVPVIEGVRPRSTVPRVEYPAVDADVQDAEVEEHAGPVAHPRIEYLLGNDLSVETLCWYLASRDKPIEAPTLDAANAWASTVADSAWAKHGLAMREAITRRLGMIEGHMGPLGLLDRAQVGSPMWVKAHTAAERLGLAKNQTEWPARALVGIALAVAEEKTEARAPKKGPGAKALDKALEVPGGWDAILAGFRRAGVEPPVMGSLTDQQQGELAYSVVTWCQASASAEDTTALVCEALSDAP